KAPTHRCQDGASNQLHYFDGDSKELKRIWPDQGHGRQEEDCIDCNLSCQNLVNLRLNNAHNAQQLQCVARGVDQWKKSTEAQHEVFREFSHCSRQRASYVAALPPRYLGICVD